ncbi:MAG: hypothetical protein M5U01_04185 [Ardenticatenaceae bacterium]|nr:hypothetical protein [Ardenticatenaceae bacterium]
MSDVVLEPRPLERVPSGIAGLDTILGGGFFRGGLYAVVGLPGTGKTILGNQICFHHVASGGRAVYITLLGEEHARMLAYLQSLAFFKPEVIANTLYYFSGYQALLQGRLSGLLEFLRRAIRDHKATMLVLDGLVTAKKFAESELDFKNFMHDIQVYFAAAGCTTFLLSPPDNREPRPEDTVVDGLVILSHQTVGLRAMRELELPKLRGSSYLEGRHVFEITSAGIVIHPRTEALLAPSEITTAPAQRRMHFGLPELDDMLRGGLVSGSTTMLLGAAGSGKTLLGLHFLAAGAREEQNGLYFGFYEPPARLIAKADQIGLDLNGHVSRGLIEVVWQPILESHIDILAGRLLDVIRRKQIHRLFIDGQRGFQEVAVYPERIGRFFTALTNELRARGVTTIFAVQTHDLFGSTSEMPITGVPAMTDNIIFLRYVELRSQFHRLISLVKVGESDYDPTIHEFQITRHGIDVAATSESAEAILTGVGRPRLPDPPAP